MKIENTKNEETATMNRDAMWHARAEQDAADIDLRELQECLKTVFDTDAPARARSSACRSAADSLAGALRHLAKAEAFESAAGWSS